jgi:hypothetical protein
MKLRKIKTGLFAKTAIGYRLSIILIEFLVIWIVTQDSAIAIGVAVSLNVINIIWYVLYHYFILRTYKFGRD